MKKIQLEKYTKITKKQYVVVFGNGAKQVFSQEKQTQIFLRKASKDLTQIAFDINGIDSQLYQINSQYFLLNEVPEIDRQLIQGRSNYTRFLNKSIYTQN